jgi:hypothetical protein
MAATWAAAAIDMAAAMEDARAAWAAAWAAAARAADLAADLAAAAAKVAGVAGRLGSGGGGQRGGGEHGGGGAALMATGGAAAVSMAGGDEGGGGDGGGDGGGGGETFAAAACRSGGPRPVAPQSCASACNQGAVSTCACSLMRRVRAVARTLRRKSPHANSSRPDDAARAPGRRRGCSSGRSATLHMKRVDRVERKAAVIGAAVRRSHARCLAC